MYSQDFNDELMTLAKETEKKCARLGKSWALSPNPELNSLKQPILHAGSGVKLIANDGVVQAPSW